MVNNFYVGIIHYGKKFLKAEYSEKVVLYTEDKINFLDLRNNTWYTTNTNEKNYVDIDSVILTDVSLYREDYLYMLSKYKNGSLSKKRKI